MWLDQPVTGDSLPPKTLCLTFDDGPGRTFGSNTVELAQFLAEQDVMAAFFLVGKNVRQCPGDVDRIRRLGHTIGNHSHSHQHLTDSFISAEQVLEEVTRANSEIGHPEVPVLFRPPYGAWSPRLAHILNRDPRTFHNHLGPINWDLGGFDFEYWKAGKSPAACAASYTRVILRRRARNGIVLFHDASADFATGSQSSKTFELLQILIPQLRSQGYSFKNLPEVPKIQSLLERERAAQQPPPGMFSARPDGGPSAS